MRQARQDFEEEAKRGGDIGGPGGGAAHGGLKGRVDQAHVRLREARRRLEETRKMYEEEERRGG
eukprot:CAMPEP_0179247236 /NCGR_PEP_ID=MMETSP0797-20121207/19504_1 /TAXON_ID=47934 /ORGANISM="Dinophysis acuminata, Strain DAEP01" /LENGTH=63 /DNA_ID=CAMNT_0020954847 /DNA_START=13 /DNA_END=204 /DNA_ORIENTATION=+